ncbi:MAG: PD-(D/E)XK nuclease family protein [Candidatus Pseudobacter hemicellulosilyticus]|uniref:PD-(D/E)XK nuclease family protein n=1 Tax=Candidatus Pseudobacter hemicellulosilyticus TaxID=3121375 RepID=A0AAJ6BED6_9BACT|nr:MAG: PD-(D/E)XK nuclease family protein [Pseudobacter sp.]
MEKLHIYLGLSGDAPVFHTTNAVPGHYAGQLLAGPEKMVSLLELHLGLTGVYPNFTDRVLALKTQLTAIKKKDHFFSASFKADPLGVARRLLTLWDSWRMAGWDPADPKKAPARMKELAAMAGLLQPCGPGMVERILAIQQELQQASLPFLSVHLLDPIHYFPKLFRDLLQLLSDRTQLQAEEISPQAKPGTDLRKLQDALLGLPVKAGFTNDHSLHCIYFDNDILAANAMHSVQQTSHWKPVLVSKDNSLLNGLNISRNLPVGHWQTISGNGQVSQLFFLATALFKRPVNTGQVISFLSAPLTPFAKELARKLVRIFSEKPGFGNEEWNQAIQDYLDSIKGHAREAIYRKQVAGWLEQQQFLEEPVFAIALLTEIYTMLEQWAAQAVHHAAYGVQTEQLLNLAGLCRQLKRALEGEGDTISSARFDRLQAELFADTPSLIAEAQEGSLDAVPEPAAVWSPVKELLWMNAARFETSSYGSKYWYQEEIAFFGQKGLPVPDESLATAAYNYGLKRMVLAAEHRLVLVLPAAIHGAPVARPFCLDEWDQLISLQPVTIQAGQLLQQVPWNSGQLLLQPQTPIALPAPVTFLRVAPENFTRDKESFSSIDKFIQHPAEWYMDYRLRLRHSSGIKVPDTNLIKGVIADRVIQLLLTEDNRRESWWKKEKLFREKVTDTCQLLLLQEGLPFLEKKTKRLLMEYQRTLANSFWSLRSFIEANKLVIKSTQCTVSGSFDNTPFEGFIDLLLTDGKKDLVIDLKWANNSNTYRYKLRMGTDLQLVLYKTILGAKGATGYFMLNDGQTIMRQEKANQDLQQVTYVDPEEGISTETVFRKALNSLQYRRQELAAGNAEVGYEELMEELPYAKVLEAQDLYPLTQSFKRKQVPYNDDYFLFYGKIK